MAVFSFVVVLFLGASAEAQLPKQGTYTGKFGYWGVGTVHQLEKDHVFFVGQFTGVFYNDSPGGFIDKTSVACPGWGDLLNGIEKAAGGYCIVTDADGDKAFLVWKGKGTEPGKGGGDFQWTGGTGKFRGISGNNMYQFQAIGQTDQGSVVWKGEWRVPE
jgi:hypothetical protein